MNIPTVQPMVHPTTKPSNKAVFNSVDVENTFERAIKNQHRINFKNYVNSQLNRKG
jgi:hypothetical protein